MAFDKTAAGLLNGRPVKVAKALAERDEVLVGQHLPTHQNRQVVKPGTIDGGKLAVIDRPEIDILNFRRERRHAFWRRVLRADAPSD